MRRSFRSLAAAILLALMPAAALAQALPSPKVTTRQANDNSDVAASTRYVDLSAQILLNAIAGKAPLASPTFTGTVSMPALSLMGAGSTGDLSGMSVSPDAGAATNSLALFAGNIATRVSSTVQMRALATRTGALANLTEGGREGLFAWTPGDFSYPLSADANEALYVKATSVAASAGAWVRLGAPPGGCLPVSWFGLNYTNDTNAIQAALNIASNLATKCVSQGSASLKFSATLSVPAGVKVVGNGVGVWTQAAGVNLPELVVMGNGSAWLSAGLDGNWANNPSVAPERVGIRIGGASDVVVASSRLRGFASYGVVINGGQRNKVVGNSITDYYTGAVQIYGADGWDENLIDDNSASLGGWGGFGIAHSSGNTMTRNRATGYLIGGPGARVTANLAGRTVTWASGPKFTGARKGSWVVFNNGSEARIATVVSDTVVTTETDLPTLSGAQISLGTGDLMGVVQGSYNRVSWNTLRNTATFGLGCSLGNTDRNCSFNQFTYNTFSNIGKNAINFSATVFNGGFLDGNVIAGNAITLAGIAGGIGAADRIPIYLQGVGPGSITNTAINDNTVASYFGDGQSTYWLGTNGQMDNGSVTVNGNLPQGMANDGIFGGIRSIDLSGQWGSTASVSNVVTDGKSVQFDLTAGGTGLAAGGSFTVQKIVEASPGKPHPAAKAVNGSGYLPTMWGENLSNRGAWVAYQRDNLAPASGQTFTFTLKD